MNHLIPRPVPMLTEERVWFVCARAYMQSSPAAEACGEIQEILGSGPIS